MIEKNEVDIQDIPIKEITDQYLEYLQAMHELELEVTSEFLVMAATLLSIKSKMLLPKPPVFDPEYDEYGIDEEYDPRMELVQKLIEYRKYKAIADHLRDKEHERSLIYTREPEDLTPFMPVITNPVRGLDVNDLIAAFQKAMKRMAVRNIVTKIRKDEISVKDRILEVADYLKRKGGQAMFSKLLGQSPTREGIIVTFMALLELMKMKKIVCHQHKLFDDIVIHVREGEQLDGISTDEVSY